MSRARSSSSLFAARGAESAYRERSRLVLQHEAFGAMRVVLLRSPVEHRRRRIRAGARVEVLVRWLASPARSARESDRAGLFGECDARA